MTGSTTISDGSTHVGRRVLRLEDRRLLRGAGRFVDDVDLPGQLWLRVVRATSAHARLLAVDVAEALAAPGVHAVLTGADVAEVEPIPLRIPLPGVDLEPYLQPVLARDRVRYVGEPVAVVVAETPYQAEDAAELVEVELEELPVVLGARAGLDEGAARCASTSATRRRAWSRSTATSTPRSGRPRTSCGRSSRSAGTPACRWRREGSSPTTTPAAAT
ncbi:MAG: hypothetical protein R3C15_01080 [Thermoleophilia bacterium]